MMPDFHVSTGEDVDDSIHSTGFGSASAAKRSPILVDSLEALQNLELEDDWSDNVQEGAPSYTQQPARPGQAQVSVAGDSSNTWLPSAQLPTTQRLSNSNAVQATIASDLRAYFDATAAADVEWLQLPEYPTALEIAGISDGKAKDRDIVLQENRLNMAWESIEQYLETQYRLMREDASANLREAVEDLRRNPHQLEGDFQNFIHIYERVYISGITIASEGLAHRLDFSTGRAKRRIAWASSKRLKPGTLVALTPFTDHFHTECQIAVVAARPLTQLEEDMPAIDVYFCDPSAIEIDPHAEYIMVEARSGYYEACRTTLMALQHMAREIFPLSDHLVFIKQTIGPPLSLVSNPNMTLAPAFDGPPVVGPQDILQAWPRAHHVTGLEPGSNPADGTLQKTNLDESQFEALRRILTKRLAIVQGPPGTGKTHVSVVALRVLLENKRPGSPPIIITAQTNHALDQLLRHVSRFAPDFIRLGGQTQDFDTIEPRTLYRVKETNQPRYRHLRSRWQQMRRRNDKLIKEMKELLEPLSSLEAFAPSVFLHYKLINQDQYESLCQIETKWIGDFGRDSSDATVAWGTGSIRPFERRAPRAQDHLQLDLEDEDVSGQKDAFLERGVLEGDDKDVLHGTKIFFSTGYTSTTGLRDTEERVKGLLERYQNMNEIPQRSRGLVYLWLQTRVKDIIRDRVRSLAKALKSHALEVKIARMNLDAAFLMEAPVVGMTTTGLSKYRPLLNSIRPTVVLIEEAAETQEAYVTAACFESLEHLILVGDHQQLRSHCQSKGMEDFNLDVSLFERMVHHNKVEFQQLTTQRRMLPEMRHVLNVIYKNLTDHPCVHDRDDIPGMGGRNLWFMTHQTAESMDDHYSWYNEEEAHMVANFFEYLVTNGTPSEHITILTFYNGQRRKILSTIRKLDRFVVAGQINVCTVDSYQGEENEVVILSLVRNNDRQDAIGFLNVENRVCVAMSRARRGFYIFGNAPQLYSANATWKELIRKFSPKWSLDGQPRLGKHLPIVCQRHKKCVKISSSIDWLKNSGGCDALCDGILPCGHSCRLFCHPEDHDVLPCFEPCARVLECGHRCARRCADSPCQCEECAARARDYNRRYQQHRRQHDEEDPLKPRFGRAASIIDGSNERSRIEGGMYRHQDKVTASVRTEGPGRSPSKRAPGNVEEWVSFSRNASSPHVAQKSSRSTSLDIRGRSHDDAVENLHSPLDTPTRRVRQLDQDGFEGTFNADTTRFLDEKESGTRMIPSAVPGQTEHRTVRKDVLYHSRDGKRHLKGKRSWEASSNGDSTSTTNHHQHHDYDETEAGEGGEDLISF